MIEILKHLSIPVSDIRGSHGKAYYDCHKDSFCQFGLSPRALWSTFGYFINKSTSRSLNLIPG